jgi:hypothetical protein
MSFVIMILQAGSGWEFPSLILLLFTLLAEVAQMGGDVILACRVFEVQIKRWIANGRMVFF